MRRFRWECPECDADLREFRGQDRRSIRCPECRVVVRLPDEDREEDDDRRSRDRSRESRRDDRRDDRRNDRRDDRRERPRPARYQPPQPKSSGALHLWLGLIVGLIGIIVIIVLVATARRGDEKGDPVVQQKQPRELDTKQGNNNLPKVGAEAIRIVRRIDTNIPLPQQEPFIFIRGILSLHGSSDGSVIAIGSELSPRKYFLNGTTGRSITEFDDPECRLGDDRIFNGRGPVISPDGRYAVFGIRGIRQKTVKILNVSTGNTVQALGDEKINHIETVAFSQEAVFALVHSVGDYEIAGWSLPQGVRIGRMKMPENREPSLLFPVAGGRTLVVVSHSRLTPQRLVPPQADLFDVQQNRHIRTLSLAYQDISAVAVSPDGKLLAVVGNHGDHKTLDVYDIVNNRKISSLGRFDGFSAQGVNFLPNGKIVVQTESAVTGYDAQTGQSKFAWTHNGNLLNRPITHLSFLSNGDMLMVLDGPMATLVIGRLNES